jgi:hypothetical protein
LLALTHVRVFPLGLVCRLIARTRSRTEFPSVGTSNLASAENSVNTQSIRTFVIGFVPRRHSNTHDLLDTLKSKRCKLTLGSSCERAWYVRTYLRNCPVPHPPYLCTLQV